MLLLQGCALPTCKFHMMEGQKRVEDFPGRAIFSSFEIEKIKVITQFTLNSFISLNSLFCRTCNKKTMIHLRS